MSHRVNTESGRTSKPLYVVDLSGHNIPKTHAGLLEEAMNKHGIEVLCISLNSHFLETATVSSYMGEPVPDPEHLLHRIMRRNIERSIEMYRLEV